MNCLLDVMMQRVAFVADILAWPLAQAIKRGWL